jgi:hypothetical protein
MAFAVAVPKNRRGITPYHHAQPDFHKENDFPMMRPQTGLEIILKAVFLQRFCPFDRLRAGGSGV